MPKPNSGRQTPALLLLYATLLGLSFVPGLSLWVLWLVPAPLIAFHVSGRRRLTVVLASLYTVCLLLAGLNAAAPVIGVGVYFLSWVMGDVMTDAESPYPALITGTFVFLMIELVLLALYRWFGGHLYADLSHALRTSLTEGQGSLGFTPSAASDAVNSLMAWLRNTLPGVLAVFSMLVAMLNFSVATRLVGGTPATSILRGWRLPGSFIGVYVVVLGIVVFGALRSSPVLWQAANSAVLIADFLLGLQGLAWVWRRIAHQRYAGLWLTLLVVAALFPIVGDVYVLLGLFVVLLDTLKRAPRI